MSKYTRIDYTPPTSETGPTFAELAPGDFFRMPHERTGVRMKIDHGSQFWWPVDPAKGAPSFHTLGPRTDVVRLNVVIRAIEVTTNYDAPPY